MIFEFSMFTGPCSFFFVQRSSALEPRRHATGGSGVHDLCADWHEVWGIHPIPGSVQVDPHIGSSVEVGPPKNYREVSGDKHIHRNTGSDLYPKMSDLPRTTGRFLATETHPQKHRIGCIPPSRCQSIQHVGDL